MWDDPPKDRGLEWVDAPIDSTTSERRRMQNRIAQRNHRKRCREKQAENEQPEMNTLVWKPPCTIPKPPPRVLSQQNQNRDQTFGKQYANLKQSAQQRQQHIFSSVHVKPAPATAPAIPHQQQQQQQQQSIPLDDIILDPMDDFSEFLAANEAHESALTQSQSVFNPSDFTILNGNTPKQQFDPKSNEPQSNNNNNTKTNTTTTDLDLTGGSLPETNLNPTGGGGPGSNSNSNSTTTSWDIFDSLAETELNPNSAAPNHHDSSGESLRSLSSEDFDNSLKFSGWNALHLAAYHGQPWIIRLLLTSKRVEVNSVTRQGLSALHIVAGTGSAAHQNQAQNQNAAEEVARELLDLGADAWLQDRNGQTALHVAVESGCGEVARLLVECRGGGLLHVRDASGCTALHKAIEMGREEIVGVLLEWGADPAVTVL